MLIWPPDNAHFKAFSQGNDIEADLRGGWCAGLTALASAELGPFDKHQTGEAWAKTGFKKVSNLLDKKIQQKDIQAQTQTFQRMLEKLDPEIDDVTSDIHSSDFNCRPCKILISACAWVPVLGYLSYAWSRTWKINHVGLIARGGNKLLIFEPNYGVGLFTIGDTKALSLDELTKALHRLAWMNGYGAYYGANVAAMAVIDQDAFKHRFSKKDTNKIEDLLKAKFYRMKPKDEGEK